MKNILSILMVLITFAMSQKITIIADKLYTMSNQGNIPNAQILINGGKIEKVGEVNSTQIPHDYKIYKTRYATPGFIDAHASIGLSGIFNVRGDQDLNETTNPNTADLRAIDGYNPDDELVLYALKNGITTMQVGPGPTNPIAGQAAIFKTCGKTVEEVILKSPSGMIFNLGEYPKWTYGENGKTPQTRMATAAIIRKALQEAKEYTIQRKTQNSENYSYDTKKAALAMVVNREIPAIFSCHRSDDIMTALRIGREFGLSLILDSVTEGYLVRDKIKKENVPVLLAPTMQRLDRIETQNSSYENPALLWDVGIQIAITSGYESYVPKTRIISFEAGIAMANKLPEEEALRAITINPARIMGIDDRLGSIETGKEADIVLFDGEPLEYLTHVTHVFVNGQLVYERED